MNEKRKKHCGTSEKFTGFEPYKLRNYRTFNWVVYFFKNNRKRKKELKEKKIEAKTFSCPNT